MSWLGLQPNTPCLRYLLLYLKPHLLGAEGGAAPKEG